MLIIVTDSGLIWNHKNPYLEQYAESVLVVCLSGKKVTDKYRCFVSPYRFHGLGGTGFGVQTAQYRALESVSEDFIRTLRNHDHIVFLTDNDPEDIYKMYTDKPSEEDIQYSANWILENIGVKAEIFSYLVLPHTVNKR